jgi:hypothetical protein
MIVAEQDTYVVTSQGDVTLVSLVPAISVIGVEEGVAVVSTQNSIQVISIEGGTTVVPVENTINVISNPVTSVVGAKVTLSMTAPSSPAVGDLWIRA